jgi:hypothetical protein
MASTSFSWFQLLSAALAGAGGAKIVDIVYAELRRFADRKQSATRFLDSHLDPLLKTADEVFGKLHSLANEDFGTLAGRQISLEASINNDFGSLLYLFGRLWAHAEIIRQEGLSVALAKDKRGAQLQGFLNCLESRQVRIIDRISQRAVGEIMLKPASNPPRTIGYVEFIRMVEEQPEVSRWLVPLVEIFVRTQHTRVRQQILKYGVVIHALIDTLDARHSVTKNRPS